MGYNTTVTIRIERNELDKMKKRAVRKKMTLGEYIRYMIDLGEKTDYY